MGIGGAFLPKEMATLSSIACTSIRCSTIKDGHDPSKEHVIFSTPKNKRLAVTSNSIPETLYVPNRETRRNIPKERQLEDPFRQAKIIEEEVCYRQTLVIRSYEVGPDEAATIETILQLLQETALNHAWMTGLFGGASGATHGMIRNNLLWVVSRMHVQVDCYPIWGEVIEIDTWVGASGRHGMRREWLLRSHSTGQIFARATSKWAMMNQQTRRLSKMPDEVRAEISPWFNQKTAFPVDTVEKIEKLNQNPEYIKSGLKASWSNLDLNQHVNNVKYAGWMLEAIPEDFLKNNQLFDITIVYKRECGISDVVQSLCEPQEGGILENAVQDSIKGNLVNGFSTPLASIDGNECLSIKPDAFSRFAHLLQTEEESKIQEIVRGRTTWKKKKLFPTPSSVENSLG